MDVVEDEAPVLVVELVPVNPLTTDPVGSLAFIFTPGVALTPSVDITLVVELALSITVDDAAVTDALLREPEDSLDIIAEAVEEGVLSALTSLVAGLNVVFNVDTGKALFPSTSIILVVELGILVVVET